MRKLTYDQGSSGMMTIASKFVSDTHVTINDRRYQGSHIPPTSAHCSV